MGNGFKVGHKPQLAYMPHPQTVKARMRMIQAGWSEAERRTRIVGGLSGAEIPIIHHRLFDLGPDLADGHPVERFDRSGPPTT